MPSAHAGRLESTGWSRPALAPPSDFTSLQVLEDTPRLHHVIYCSLCSCYPRPVLGQSPEWYRTPNYRRRIVRWATPGPTACVNDRLSPNPEPRTTAALPLRKRCCASAKDTFLRSGSFPTAVPMPYIVGTDLVRHGGRRLRSRHRCFGPASKCGATAWAAVDVKARRPSTQPYRPIGSITYPTVWTRTLLSRSPSRRPPRTWRGLSARLRPGETTFVRGGAGNVGTAAIQVAWLAGARGATTFRW